MHKSVRKSAASSLARSAARSRRNRSKKILVGAATTVLAPLFVLHPALAQTWVGNGSSPYWDVASNWSTGTVPGSGANVTNNTANTINHRQNTDSINSFASTNLGAFLMSGGILNILTSFTTNGAYTQTGGTLNVASFTSTSSSPLTISGGTLNVTGTLSTSSTLTLSGGTIQNATIANPGLLLFNSSGANVLDNVSLGNSTGLTLNGIGNGYNSYLHIADSFNFASGSVFNLGTNTASGYSSGYLVFDSTSGTVNPTFNNATVNMGADSGYAGFGSGFNSSGVLTFGSGLTLQGHGTVGQVDSNPYGASLVSYALINANTANSSLNVNGTYLGNVTNNGTMEATASGSALYINASGTGTFINNGTLLTTNGGRIYLAGIDNNSGKTFDITSVTGANNANGTVVLNGGTISGGTLNNGQFLLVNNSGANMLDNVSLGNSTGLTLNGIANGYNSYLHIADAFSFTSGSVFNLGTNTASGYSSGYLVFDSTSGTVNPTFDNATVNLGADSGYIGFGSGFNASGILTLGSGLTIQGHGSVGQVDSNPYGAGLVSYALINANMANNSLNVNGTYLGNVTNNGTMEATASGAALYINASGTGTFINNGTLLTTNGGRIYLAGIDNNAGKSFDITSVTGANNANGTVVLNGGTISGGTINNGQFLIVNNSGANMLDNVSLGNSTGLTLNGIGNGYNSYLHIADSFSFTNGSVFNLGTNTASGYSSGYLVFDSTSGTVNPTFNNALVNLGLDSGYVGFGSGFNSSGILTLGSGLTIQGHGSVGQVDSNPYGAALVSNGLINANTANSSLNVNGTYLGNVTNNGTMEATASGATLYINASGTGTFINNGTLLTTNGGHIYLAGIDNNSGKTFDITSVTGANNANGTVVLNGGTISGGTINNAQFLIINNSGSNVFDNVSLGNSTGLTLNGIGNGYNSYLHIADAFSFTNGSVFNLGTNTASGYSSGYLVFDSTSGTVNPTFNNATVNLGLDSGYVGFGSGFNSSGVLTFGSGLTLQGHGSVGQVDSNPYGAGLVSYALINANTANNSLNVNGTYLGNVTNNGTMEATASGATLYINASGTGTFINNGTLLTTNGGRIYLAGIDNNSGKTFDITSVTGANNANGTVVMNGSTISGGTINNGQFLLINNSGSNVLDNVSLGNSTGLTLTGLGNGYNSYLHIADAFSFTSGSIFNLGINTASGYSSGYLVFDSTSGTVNPTFDNATVNLGADGGYVGFGSGFNSAGILTLGSGLTIQGHGSVGQVDSNPYGAALVNNGLINANMANNSLNVNGTYLGNLTNNGTMEATASGASLYINASGTGTFINNGTLLTTNGGRILLAGIDNNAGKTFDITSVTGANNANGTVVLNAGTLSGGTLNNGQWLLINNSGANMLDNVNLGNSTGLTLTGIGNGYNSYLHIADAFTFTNGSVFNLGTNTASGYSSGYLVFDSTSGTVNPTFNNATVNLGLDSGNVGFGSGFNSSGILTLGSGLTIQGHGSVGQVDSNPYGAALVSNGLINANIANNSLNVVATYNGNVTNNGTMEATASGASLNITTSGTGAFYNTGTLLYTANSSGTVNGTTQSSSGKIQIDSGSSLAMKSTTSTQTAGTTIVNGGLTITNSSSNTYTVQGGALYGTGTITGTLSNTGGKVGAGIPGTTPSAGTLTLVGNYLQSSGGTFSSALGGLTQGSQYDLFSVSGTVTLSGNLDIVLINGFIPTPGQTFQIIKDTGTTGTFSNAPNNVISDESGQYFFSVLYTSNGVYLGEEATPEPGTVTLLLAAMVPAGVGFAVRRRNRRKG